LGLLAFQTVHRGFEYLGETFRVPQASSAPNAPSFGVSNVGGQEGREIRQAELAKRETKNSEAYHLYLKGRFFVNKVTIDIPLRPVRSRMGRSEY
jgi:hypothetical protein